MLTLLEICHHLHEEIQGLKDEIARLKGLKARPKIRPSKLEDGKEKQRLEKQGGGRRGKRSKTSQLEIHDVVIIPPLEVPPGSRFKEYHGFTVQDIQIKLRNTRYLLERWETPSGGSIVGKLPAELGGGHFGPTVLAFILHQYHHAHVTQPLILEQLLEWGVDISAGKLSGIITEGKEGFHAEKDELLRAGLEHSTYIHVDDTGARHQGKNGYCTHIGNELFAYFASTDSKSRLNFLNLLRAGREDYVLNDEAFSYMRAQKLPQGPLALLAKCPKVVKDEPAWQATLEQLGITRSRHVRIATEGALLGSVLEHGWNLDLAIMSDDAGQFAVMLHALCWIHAERLFAKLVGYNDAQRKALEGVRTEIWDFYAELWAYKFMPDETRKVELEAWFDALCSTKTCFVSVNKALERMHDNKKELLLVLDRPDVPLHNNLSENDIREYVKKRKISGSTRSDEGRRCRDTFTSLKKTCRKHGVSFWTYLSDRIGGINAIPPLAELIRRRALASGSIQPRGP